MLRGPTQFFQVMYWESNERLQAAGVKVASSHYYVPKVKALTHGVSAAKTIAITGVCAIDIAKMQLLHAVYAILRMAIRWRGMPEK